MFINIHTHEEMFDGKVEIVNLSPFDAPRPLYYSRGLHPWDVKNNYDKELEQLRISATERRCIAIGECGLDKVCSSDLELQKKVFEEHIVIANELSKPLIIHCVKAHNEVVSILKKKNNNVPVIFHGFVNNLNIAASLLKEGHFLSFGKGLLNENMNVPEVLRNTGKDKFFLETDDDGIPINYIYKKASEILGVDEDVLKEQLKRNYQRTFKEEIL